MSTLHPDQALAAGLVDHLEAACAPKLLDYAAAAADLERDDPDGLSHVIAELRRRGGRG